VRDLTKKSAKKKRSFLPKLKKSLSSYARSERGQISKQSMLTVGSIVGGAAIGAAIASKSVKGAGIRLFRASGKEKTMDLGDGMSVHYTTTGEIIVTHSHHVSY